MALDAFKESKTRQESINKKNIIKNIIDYNEVDCKVLWEILKILRELK